MTPLTLCPGNLQYMPPEALEEPPSYAEKLDIFSFGVLLVQVMTRQFPDPGPRFQVIDIPDDPRIPEGTVRVSIPETQRRSAHLSSTHPLKQLPCSHTYTYVYAHVFFTIPIHLAPNLLSRLISMKDSLQMVKSDVPM